MRTIRFVLLLSLIVVFGAFDTVCAKSVIFEPVAGETDILFEAEEAALERITVADLVNDKYAFNVVKDIAASGESAVAPMLFYKPTAKPYAPAELTAFEFNFKVAQTSGYYIWARCTMNPFKRFSIFYSLDQSDYNLFVTYSMGESGYKWVRITYTGVLEGGTTHNYRLFPREQGMNIDKIFITAYPYVVPTGIMDSTKDVTIKMQTLPEGAYPVPPVTPPNDCHPRLYFTENDIPKLRSGMTAAQNAVAAASFNNLIKNNYTGVLSEPIGDASNYNASILTTIEAWAFKYVLDEYGKEVKDYTYADKAISAIKNYMKTVDFGKGIQDVTRQMGHVIFVASEVYDWCYDRLTIWDKAQIISMAENIAKDMEVGYPPNRQGAIIGHGSEAQIMRDLLSLAVAAYDERPDIYNYVGGRLFAEFIQPREFWYPSNTSHQGSGYGPYRYQWDTNFLWIINKMTNGEYTIFSREHGNVGYEWIYTRRPDGQTFRTGDAGGENQPRSYNTAHNNALVLSANFWGDGYLKDESLRQMAIRGIRNDQNGTTATHFLIFNDPNLEGKSITELPLSRYFGSPNGMMIARTGWNVNYKNPAAVDDVVAMMKIGEFWGGNHHHLDAGNFQIYYKGILASESGYYESYGTFHDGNYNKRSIAHNTLTIYQPGEVFTPYKPAASLLPPGMENGINDGGQRFPNNGVEAVTFDIWQKVGTGNKKEYQTGRVIDHEFGPDKITPEYTYIRGDITAAYHSSKVDQVSRAMVFMPLDDNDYKAIMVIMDKVISKNASYKKKWLLHTQTEPEIMPGGAVVKSTRALDNGDNIYNGKLTLQTLLPVNAEINKIGGDDKQYWVGDQSKGHQHFLTNGVNIMPAAQYNNGSIEAGWGRIEVSPPTASLEDKFLNVMAVSDANNNAAALNSVLITGTNLIGVKTAGKVIMFADVAQDRIQNNASFVVPGAEDTLCILITGVKAGRWKISNERHTWYVEASEDGGTLYFTAGSGTYFLSAQ